MSKKSPAKERFFWVDFAGERGTKFAVYESVSADDRTLVDRVINPLYEHGIVFLPSPKQIEFFESKSPFLLYGGGRGGGKTIGDMWKGIFVCHLVPGAEVIILRRTMPQLKKTILQEFSRVPHVDGYSDIYENYNISEGKVTFGNGSVLWFASADNEKKWRDYLSGNFTMVIFDELSEFTYEMFWGISGSCRTTIEEDIFGDEVIPQVAATTNPGGDGAGFIKSLWIDKKAVPGDEEAQYDSNDYEFIQSLIKDNPYLAEGTKAHADYMKKLRKMPKKIQAAWIEGKWDAHEGMYFEEYQLDWTRVTNAELQILFRKQHWQTSWISIDWGKTHAAVAQWHKYVDIMGSDGTKVKLPVTYREKHWHKLSEGAVAEEICKITEDFDDPSKIVKIYLSPELGKDEPFARARRMSDVFRGHKMPGTQPAYDDRIEGWTFLNGLTVTKNVLGNRTLCGVLISEDCPTLLDSIPMLSHDPKKDGDVFKTDSLADDYGDCWRYGIASHVRPKDTPFEERVQEALAGEEDMTKKAMIHRKLEFEEIQKNKPFVLNKSVRVRNRRRR